MNLTAPAPQGRKWSVPTKKRRSFVMFSIPITKGPIIFSQIKVWSDEESSKLQGLNVAPKNADLWCNSRSLFLPSKSQILSMLIRPVWDVWNMQQLLQQIVILILHDMTQWHVYIDVWQSCIEFSCIIIYWYYAMYKYCIWYEVWYIDIQYYLSIRIYLYLQTKVYIIQ